jgi:hypothetical protein
VFKKLFPSQSIKYNGIGVLRQVGAQSIAFAGWIWIFEKLSNFSYMVSFEAINHFQKAFAKA